MSNIYVSPLPFGAFPFQKHQLKSFFQPGHSASWDVEGCLNAFQVFSQNCLDEVNDCTQVHLVHWIAHEHLVHTKVLYVPERIVDEVCAAMVTKRFVVHRTGSSRMSPSRRLSPIHHWARQLLAPEQFSNSSCSLGNLNPSSGRRLGLKNSRGEELVPGG